MNINRIMNDTQLALYLSFVHGVVFTNLSTSINHYRNGHSFSILKIIFNLSGATEPFLLFLYKIISYNTINSCQGLIYTIESIDFLRRESLALLLLWRLKRIIGCFLFFLRTFCQIIFIALIHANLNINLHDAMGRNACEFNFDISRIAGWGYLGTDLLIDIFVTIRLVQILTEGSRKAAQVDSTSRQILSNLSNCELFNAVIRWNYLRLSSASMDNILTIINLIPLLNSGYLIIQTLRTFNYIALSYLITIDKEIVRVIAGICDDCEFANSRIIYTIESEKHSICIMK